MSDRKETGGALFWMGIGICVCLLSYNLQLGNWHEPRPGFFPFFAGLVLTAVSIVVFLQALLRGRPSGIEKQEGLKKWKVAATLGILLAYAFFIDFLGFGIITFLLFLSLLWGIEKFRILKALSLSVLFTSGVYLIFQVWLKVPMPSGFFP